MYKKLLVATLLTCAVPAVASAWQLTTKAASAGGNIVGNGLTQTVVNGSVSTNQGSGPAKSLTATALPGYTISQVRTGVVAADGFTWTYTTLCDNVASTAAPACTSPYSANVGGTTDSYLSATFLADKMVTATAVTGSGSITPKQLSNVYFGQKAAQAITFRLIPKFGYSVTAATVPAGYVLSDTLPAAANKIVTATLPAGAIIPAGTVAATFGSDVSAVLANAGNPQVADSGTTVTLKGTSSNAVFQKWSSANGLFPAATGSNIKTFTAPATKGVYSFLYRVSDTVSSMTQVTVGTAESNNYCISCHTDNGIAPAVSTNFPNSIHAQSSHSTCGSCHVGASTAGHPGSLTSNSVTTNTFVVGTDSVVGPYGPVAKGAVFCTACHAGAYGIPHATPVANNTCVNCHTPSGTGDAHQISADLRAGAAGCLDCHSVDQKGYANAKVNGNTGVRAVTDEFKKWSHHVDNSATLDNAHCAACHMEGKVDAGKIVVDKTYHMADGNVYLRNADTDAPFAWKTATPNHSGMDNFCLSCHDANGATSTQSGLIQAYINANGIAVAGKTASASNPFGDSITNRYDKMQRPAVVDADSQFNTGNNSHHAVKGPRYTGRTRAAGARQIASPATFANNSTAVLQGTRSTIYDAGNFNALYVPLADAAGEVAPRTGAQSLGDDSTLHCGDCHTVGQYPTAPTSAFNQVVIGAHGSNNEYMLRNSIGTDARHAQSAYVVNPTTKIVTQTNPAGAFLVCYNCHTYSKYGSAFSGTGMNMPSNNGGPHAGEYASGGRCNGTGNTITFNGYTTGAGVDGFVTRFGGSTGTVSTSATGTPTALKFTTAAPYAGEQVADFGNVLGIQCQNCHNSGLGNGYGGIHGSAKNTNRVDQNVDASVTGGAYIDGMGNTTKVQRFLPGLGDAAHVPGTLGGVTGGSVVPVNTATGPAYTYITGGISNDTNWEQKHWQQTAASVYNPTTRAFSSLATAGAGCYTLGASASAAANKLEGPSVTGEGGAATEGLDVWGGCEDHGAVQGKGDHGFFKRIVRPVTY